MCLQDALLVGVLGLGVVIATIGAATVSKRFSIKGRITPNAK
jgi:hypothetical protein